MQMRQVIYHTNTSNVGIITALYMNQSTQHIVLTPRHLLHPMSCHRSQVMTESRNCDY